MATELDHLKPPTDMQEIFLRVYVETGDSTRAAAEAGYANPDAQGRQLRRNINLAPLIRQETHRRLQEHVPAAINVLVSVMNDEKTAAGVRVDAAKGVLDRAGYVVAATKNDRLSDNRTMPELSLVELKALVAELSRQVEGQAIDITPSATDLEPLGDVLEADKSAEFRGNDAQVIDPLE